MKFIVSAVFISMLMIATAPAWSDTFSYAYKCEQQEGASDGDVMAAASAWL